MTIPRALVLMVALSAGAAQAAPGEEDFCRNGLFPTEPPFGAAKVAAPGRLYFRSDMNGCPEKRSGCNERSYVVAGDTVLTSKTRGAYTCAFFPNRVGGTAGWVETARLKPLPVDPGPAQAAWIGKWSSHDNPVLNIRMKDDRLQLGGEAWWPSPDAPIEDFPGGPHMGFLQGWLATEGNRARYDDGDGGWCKVDLTLLGDLLIAQDNDRCGGLNVTFAAVYERISTTPDACDAIDAIETENAPPSCAVSRE